MIVEPSTEQKIHVDRDVIVSEERLNEERAAQAHTQKHRDAVGPRRTITVTEPDGSTRIFRTGDKIWRGPDCIRSGLDWEDLKKSKDLVSLTESQFLINTNDPSARYMINPSGKAITTRTGIKSPGEIVTALDFARPPEPSERAFMHGRWIEMGEIYPGDDGTEMLAQLVAEGRVVDRQFLDKVKTAVKRTLSGGSKKQATAE